MGQEKRGLPITTRGSALHETSPDNKAAAAAIEVVTEPESADYLLDQFDTKMKAVDMIESSKEMRGIIVEHQSNVHMMREGQERQWFAQEPKSDYINYEAARAKQSSKALAAKEGPAIKVELTLSDDSQLLCRYYTAEDKQSLAPESKTSYGKLLGSFAAENKLFIDEPNAQNKVLMYENDGNGHKRMEGSEPVLADPVTTRKVLSEFQVYLQKQGINNTTVSVEPFPVQVPAPPKPGAEAPRAEAERPEASGPSTEPGSTPTKPSV